MLETVFARFAGCSFLLNGSDLIAQLLRPLHVLKGITMLKFSRRPGEEIIVGDNIVIRRIDQRTIGVYAPDHVEIHRAEVYERNTGRSLPDQSDHPTDIVSVASDNRQSD